jgi:hypothetical protein
LEELFKAGIFPINTVGAPGTHGAIVMGIQGMGVRAPKAAAVAAATIGFAMLLHIPKGGTFIIGLLSIILAAGAPVMVRLSGNTDRVLGATPKGHFNIAPEQACIPIV